MTTFDEREKGYEAKLTHDEDVKFRSHARGNHLLGLWAAEKLGKSGQPAEDYANALIQADLEGNGDESAFAKLRADFAAAGLALSDGQIRSKMAELFAKASEDIIGGTRQA
jgi:hypothetical protein